jgi:hypothetical protein
MGEASFAVEAWTVVHWVVLVMLMVLACGACGMALLVRAMQRGTLVGQRHRHCSETSLVRMVLTVDGLSEQRLEMESVGCVAVKNESGD